MQTGRFLFRGERFCLLKENLPVDGIFHFRQTARIAGGFFLRDREAEIIVAKAANCRLGTFYLSFGGHHVPTAHIEDDEHTI